MEPHNSYKINIHIAKFPIKKVSGISGDFRSAPVLFSSVLHCSTCLLYTSYRVTEVCVNEQNPNAASFDRRMGFVLDHRTELDEQGRPFPLLYLKRN